MIIAGGDWQVPIIQKAKELGLFVINTNLYENSPGFKYADVGVVADVLDKKRNLEIAKKYKPDAIVTDQTDIAVATVSYLCEELDLPGIGVAIAELFTNKFVMREFCRNNGFLNPRYKLCKGIEEVIEFTQSVGFPCVIKPPASQSSRGVYKINSGGEIGEKFKRTIRFSENHKILVEEFIPGIELTVEGFKTGKKHYALAVSKKGHLKSNTMVASELLYSHYDKFIDYDSLKKLNEEMVNKTGLPFGITHAEYKFYRGKYYLVEIAARGGGTRISSHIVPLMSGVDVNKLLIKYALGEDIKEIRPKERKIFVILDFLNFRNGKVKEIRGLEKLEENKNIVDYGMNFKVGDVLQPPEDDRARHGYFIAFERSEKLIRKIVKWTKDRIKVIYE